MDTKKLHGPHGPFETLARARHDTISAEIRMREDFIRGERDDGMHCDIALRQIEKEWPSLFEKAALMAVGSFPFGHETHNLADHLDFFEKAPRTCDLRVNGFGTGLRVAIANKKLKAKRFRAVLVLLPVEEEAS